MREIDMTLGTITREFISPVPLSVCTYTLANPNMIFTASSGEGMVGCVRVYGCPLNDPPQFNEYALTSSGIARMITSHDDSHLFVAGSDGSIVVLEVRDQDGRLPMSEFGVKVRCYARARARAQGCIESRLHHERAKLVHHGLPSSCRTRVLMSATAGAVVGGGAGDRLGFGGQEERRARAA
ncbi:hypothetical protein EON66_07575 [archaeon]|nr:MAG: hypothetical protein EON66_07575 [archaeon]